MFTYTFGFSDSESTRDEYFASTVDNEYYATLVTAFISWSRALGYQDSTIEKYIDTDAAYDDVAYDE